MAELELQGLRKRFGDVIALDSIDLAVHSGQFVSLLGPSGCGKTTALRIVAGFERPDAGRILIDGADITRMPASKRDMGMVFQAYSLFPNMTAQQNVEFGLRLRGFKRKARRDRAGELLELVGLHAMQARYPHQLSGGQQQRVALARALAIEPRILLLDEPLSALDAKVRVQLRDEIRRIQTQLGITTVYVTHDQEEALSVSDQVVVLSQGRIEQVGGPADIYGNPRSIFVAEFIGTMNRIEVTVDASPAESVDAGGICLPACVVGDVPSGIRALLLVRPESIHLDSLTDGDAVPAGALGGMVVGRTFLGAVTRLRVGTAVGMLMADLPSATALCMSDAQHVAVSWDSASTHLLQRNETSYAAAPPASEPSELQRA